MSKSDPYLQFPLCALAFGKSENERLNAIIGYGIVDVGLKLWRKAAPVVKQRFISTLHEQNLPKGFNRQDSFHCAAFYGSLIMGVTYSGMYSLVEGYDRMHECIASFQQRHGRDPLVRIKRDWVFKARDHRGLTYREFSVLCGIYSCIGDKQAARVTQPRIRRCALGYRTAPIMDAEIGRRADGASPLTDRQLRDTIERLHCNKFFARCTYARRITNYSNRLDDEQLRKHVFDRHTYPISHYTSHAAKDQALTAAIKRAQVEYQP
jgi:hypothetical protein